MDYRGVFIYHKRTMGDTIMAIVDLVKMDVASDDFVVQKFNSEQQWELRLGSQLVVNEGQEAILVKGGIALDVFTPGTHTLVTGNIPFLRKITNSLFDEKTPFTAEVWFINKTVKRNLKWGTPQRIPLFDPQLNFPINIGAFGQWGFRVENSRSFVTQIVGAQLGANSKKIYEYFIGEITEKTSQTISIFIENGLSIFQINTKLADISHSVTNEIIDEFSRFGIELVNFNISNISILPDEMKKIQDVMSKKMEMQLLGSVPVGQGYVTAKSFEVMKGAAQNQGAPGALMGAGAGLGLGMGAGVPLGQQVAQVVQPAVSGMNNASAIPSNEDPVAKLSYLKKLFEDGILTQEEYSAKRTAIIEKL